MNLYDYYETEHNYYLVIKYCNRGDIENYLRENKIQYLSEGEAIRILK